MGLQQVLHGYGCHGVDAGGGCAVETGRRATPLDGEDFMIPGRKGLTTERILTTWQTLTR